MTEPDVPDIDCRVRDAFEDDAVVAARVARAALADDDRGGWIARGTVVTGTRRTRPAWIAIGAGAAIVLVASALEFWPARPLPAPAAEPSEPPMLSGFITDGALVVSLPDGSVLISAGEPRTDRLPDGFALVIVEGAIR